MQQQIKIFDTTLRDGEQCPGASLNHEEKLQIAIQLERLGVDIIEAGFPIASPDDFRAVYEIAKIIKKSTVCGLARALPKDIETCAQAIQPARKRRIHTFISTSEIHLKYQIKKTQKEVLQMTETAVKLAKKLCREVEFSAMDSTRTELKYLLQVFAVAVKSGATILNVPDTVGYALPNEFGPFVKAVVKKFARQKNVQISVHCHDDLGLATSNALVAVQNGARQIECTMNGIGERAGNTALEEVIMTIRTRQDLFKNLKINVKPKEISRTSRLVSNLTGFVIPPNKPIVGSNAFAHESGIHQHGILAKRETYEIMRAQDIGLKKNRLVLGKHSGRAALAARLKDLGFQFSSLELKNIFKRFKILSDKKKEIFDEDLEMLFSEELKVIDDGWSVDSVKVTAGTSCQPRAEVVLKNSVNKKFRQTAIGTGPVDAAYSAVAKIIDKQAKLLEFKINSITEGIDAQAVVIVKIQTEYEKIYTGRGTHTDIVVASVCSYVDALNKVK
jgi:2-isopropylmalate synthase